MPSDTTSVGPLVIPVPVGGDNTALEDITILGLLDYLGFWVRTALNDKLAEQEGPTTAGAITDACPAAHLFPWDHQGTFVRPLPGGGAVPLPGMWAWEESSEWTTEHATLLYEVVKRAITVQYIFPELLSPKGVNARHGLIPAVMRTFAKAAERGLHSAYAYGADDDGTPIAESCSWRHWRLVSAKPTMVAALPGGGTTSQSAQRATGAEKRFYPSLVATFHIWERIGLQEPVEQDAAIPGDFTVSVTDTLPDADPLDVMERVLPGA